MAMTFTLATAAREALSAVLATRLQKEKEEDDKRAAQYEEEEKAKQRGTPLTKERYLAWRKAFLEELEQKRARQEEEKVRAMNSKEREEYKKRRDRPSGECGFGRRAARSDRSDRSDRRSWLAWTEGSRISCTCVEES